MNLPSLYTVDVITSGGKLKSSWITMALSADHAIQRFNQMVGRDKGPGGDIQDSWHPKPDDVISSEQVEFEDACYQVY